MNTYKTIEEIAVELKGRFKSDIKAYVAQLREEHKAKLEKITKNRPIIARLQEAGFVSSWNIWDNGSTCSIELGFFPQNKKGNKALAEKVGAIRRLIGCRLEVVGKSLADEKRKHVNFCLSPQGNGAIRIYFSRKLPPRKKGGKENTGNSGGCRIVTRRYTTLICEA